ncbi:MAG: DUF1566 domain-containing protein [Candidatus Riflebacteria bacterium]|nr:DUF1566 domain-containing protein [Candidatus Riflebacteria bacterium]
MKNIISTFAMICVVLFCNQVSAETKESKLRSLGAKHFNLLQNGKIKEAGELMSKEIQPLRESMEDGPQQQRFIDNGDGTVTDNDYGLMWTKNANHGRRSVSDGKSYCKKLKFAGYDDWKMPNSNELETLIGAPANTLFEQLQKETYWSTTGDDMSWGKTRGVSFFDNTVRKGDGDEQYWILPVRNARPQESGWFHF